MKNMKVANKLIMGFLIVAILGVLVGVVGIVGMANLSESQRDLYYENLLAIEAITQISEAFANERNAFRTIMLHAPGMLIEDPDRVATQRASFATTEAQVDHAFALYRESMSEGHDEHDFEAVVEAWNGPYAQLKSECFAMMDAGDYAGAYSKYVTEGAAVVGPIQSGVAASVELNVNWAEESYNAGQSLYSTLTIVLVAVLIVAFSISIFLAIYISSIISKPLGALSAFMTRAGTTGDITLSQEDANVIANYGKMKDEVGQSISAAAAFVEHVTKIAKELEYISGGDLTHDINTLGDKDVMGNSLERMVHNLNNMFSEINSATGQVATGAKQVADGAQSLAQGSTEQAASIEELSASIGDIATSTKANAEIATKTARLSGTIKDNAEKGSHQMDEMITAVKDINEASLSISKIIKTIDDIAFQTNILALNAAVEAARAGQHGKGFAVVAEEVRNLASKSAEAAKDTGDMIQNSMSKAELGSQIAGETANSLKEIVSGISESSELISQIAQASEDQSLAISQINTGVDQVAQVVQQNSATAEQSAAASEQMSGQSTMLEDLISQFKLKGQGSSFKSLPSAAPKAAAAAPSSHDEPVPDSDFGGMNGSDNFGKY